ncbi:Fic family protein [Micromonospora sp. STR1s_5]|nr:Fic family protein [Micromonospora sp. STR1s_5]
MPSFPDLFVSTKETTEAVSRAVAAGTLRRLGGRLYTTNLRESPELLVRRNLWRVVALLFPGGIVADRTALEQRPAQDGSVFIVAPHGGDVDLPGITIRPRRGADTLPGDYPLRDGLFSSSPARAYLENMRPSRGRSGVPRTLKRVELEEHLDRVIRERGEVGLNSLRDEVKALAASLGLEAEAAAFDTLCGALLGTREDRLSSAAGKARRLGQPFDAVRLARFELLHDELRRRAPPVGRHLSLAGDAAVHQAFFEAYFSNFIEGTEFEIDEARAIVFEGRIPQERPEDAHDITGTFDLVSDPAEMVRLPDTAEAFSSLLRERHARIMQGRPGKRPGQFKETRNRAGNSTFVDPADVKGTLSEGFKIYRRLDEPFHRAVFMMFLVSEVHPFDDGNGRVARVMMNAELAAAGQARIIIPIVYRSNYLEGLKALTLSDNPETLIRSLDFAQRYTAAVPWDDIDVAIDVLTRTNAFVRPEDGDAQGIRLRIPAAYDLHPEPEGGPKP